MTAEKYVNAVIRRVKCSGKQRRELRQQLLSDISAAREQGEQINEILERMGSIDTVAKEFNENLPEQEQKKFRRTRMTCILSAVLLLLVFLAVVAWWLIPKYAEIGSDGRFQEQKITARLSEVVQMLNENDYASLREQSIPVMERVLNEETFKPIKEQISKDWGTFQSLGKPYMVEMTQQGKVFAVVQVSAIYENISVTFTITFDPDMRLAGLYMK